MPFLAAGPVSCTPHALDGFHVPSQLSILFSVLTTLGLDGCQTGGTGSGPAAAWVEIPACFQGHRWAGSLACGQGAWGGGGHWFLVKKLIEDSMMPSTGFRASTAWDWHEPFVCPVHNAESAPVKLRKLLLIIIIIHMTLCVCLCSRGKH